jgi:hypothetical protein
MATLWSGRGGGDERLRLAFQWQGLWHDSGLPPLACLQGNPVSASPAVYTKAAMQTWTDWPHA